MFAAKVLRLADLRLLGERDLRDIGVRLIDAKRLLVALAELKAREEAAQSEAAERKQEEEGLFAWCWESSFLFFCDDCVCLSGRPLYLTGCNFSAFLCKPQIMRRQSKAAGRRLRSYRRQEASRERCGSGRGRWRRCARCFRTRPALLSAKPSANTGEAAEPGSLRLVAPCHALLCWLGSIVSGQPITCWRTRPRSRRKRARRKKVCLLGAGNLSCLLL